MPWGLIIIAALLFAASRARAAGLSVVDWVSNELSEAPQFVYDQVGTPTSVRADYQLFGSAAPYLVWSDDGYIMLEPDGAPRLTLPAELPDEPCSPAVTAMLVQAQVGYATIVLGMPARTGGTWGGGGSDLARFTARAESTQIQLGNCRRADVSDQTANTLVPDGAPPSEYAWQALAGAAQYVGGAV